MNAPAPKKRIGEMLLEAGIIDDTQLRAALGHQRQWGCRLGQALVDLKLATEVDIVRALSLKFGFEVAKLDALEPYGLEQALKLFPREFTVRNNVFPMWADTANVTVAMSDPTNLAVVDEIRFRTGRRVKVCIGGDHSIAEAVKRHYPGASAVEAIALDLDVDPDVEGEAVFDPFGGGSKDALEAFFGGASEAPDAAEDAPVAAVSAPPAPPSAPAKPAAPRPTGAVPAQRPSPPARTGTVAVQAAGAPQPRTATVAAQAAPQAAGAPQPRTATVPAQPAPASAFPRPAPAPSSGKPAPPRAAPAASAPVPRAAPTASPAPAPATPFALELEERGDTPIEPGDPMEPREEEMVEGRSPSRELTAREIAILESLDQLASGAPAQPDVVKPAQAMAAMIRLLIRKRVVSELEFLDELSKK
jgi:hypothetical protein